MVRSLRTVCNAQHKRAFRKTDVLQKVIGIFFACFWFELSDIIKLKLH